MALRKRKLIEDGVCNKQVPSYRGGSHRCRFKAKGNGFCGTHDPDKAKGRAAYRERKMDLEFRTHPMIDEIDKAERRVLKCAGLFFDRTIAPLVLDASVARLRRARKRLAEFRKQYKKEMQ